MGKAGELDDALKGTKLAGKSAEELAQLAKAAGKSVDDIVAEAKNTAKADAAAVDAAKGGFKLDANALKDVGIAADDSKGLGKELTLAEKDAAGLEKGGAQVAKDADKEVQAAVKDTDSYLAQAKKACTSDKKMCAAAVLGGAAAIYAADKYLAVKGYKGQITKIETGMDGGVMGYGGTPVAKVTYNKPIDILKTDTIDFAATDCQPPLDGTKSPYKIAGPTEVWIKIDAPLTAPGTKGAFKITTGVLSRLGEAVGEGANAAGNAAGAVAGGAAGGFGAALKGFVSGAGLWLSIACAVLIFGFIIFKFFM